MAQTRIGRTHKYVYRPVTRSGLTRLRAEKESAPRWPVIAKRIYDYLVSCGPEGATDEEIQEALGIPGNSERPRRIALCRQGCVRDSGRQRRTRSGCLATVWVATDKPYEPPRQSES